MRQRVTKASWPPLVAAALVAWALLAPALSLAGGRVVERVRYFTHDGYTRVVLDMDAPSHYSVSGHKSPERIAINIPGGRSGKALRNLTVGHGGITRVRVNRLSWGTQVVLDLDGPASWKHFTLKRAPNKADRIVLDVIPNSGATVARTPKAPAAAAQELTRPTATTARGGSVYIVAVDAGHGGKDRGTKSGSLVEKKLALDVARRVVAEINSHAGFRAVLTRDRDVYLSLPQRVDIAEGKGADVFVSVHLNSAPNRSARGAEVFFISPRGARRTASRMLSNPNRAADELGLRGNASSDVLHMLVDVNQQAVLQRSEQLAEAILHKFGKSGLPPRRAVKQKSFAVLRNITLPSVLVECGFLSNRSDARLIRESAGRDRIAAAVADGVCAFLRANPPPRERGRPVVVHKVRAGDTLWDLSREYGSSIASILKLNRLSQASVLRIGQELLIYGRY